MTCCDGYPLDHGIWSRQRELSDKHTFPHKQPAAGDFTQVEDAIRAYCQGKDHLPQLLGPYVGIPHLSYDWYAASDNNTLYRIRKCHELEMYDVYVL